MEDIDPIRALLPLDDHDRSFAFVAAARTGNLTAIRSFIREHVDVNAGDGLALIRAGEEGHVEIVKVLLEAGADVHALRGKALRAAAGTGKVEVVKILLEAGANVHAAEEGSLLGAAKEGHLEVVKELLDAGANIMSAVRSGLLVDAALSGNRQLSQYLSAEYAKRVAIRKAASEPLATISIIQAILPHPHTTSLEIATVSGCRVVIQSRTFKVGESVVHIRIGAQCPKGAEWAEVLEPTDYCVLPNVFLGVASEGILVRMSKLKGLEKLSLLCDVSPYLGITSAANANGAKQSFVEDEDGDFDTPEEYLKGALRRHDALMNSMIKDGHICPFHQNVFKRIEVPAGLSLQQGKDYINNHLALKEAVVLCRDKSVDRQEVLAFSDGSVIKGQGAYAVVYPFRRELTHAGRSYADSNTAECAGAVDAITNATIEEATDLHLVADSRYALKAVWEVFEYGSRPEKMDLRDFEALRTWFDSPRRRGMRVYLHWIKAHKGGIMKSEGHHEADALANQTAKEAARGTYAPYAMAGPSGSSPSPSSSSDWNSLPNNASNPSTTPTPANSSISPSPTVSSTAPNAATAGVTLPMTEPSLAVPSHALEPSQSLVNPSVPMAHHTTDRSLAAPSHAPELSQSLVNPSVPIAHPRAPETSQPDPPTTTPVPMSKLERKRARESVPEGEGGGSGSVSRPGKKHRMQERKEGGVEKDGGDEKDGDVL
ncbi:hypothetical protein HDV00_012424 [Rhizophlyctis rosea]|nr:hypothetical protein HDV00_012424 [Rhizophlyctis rosea]